MSNYFSRIKDIYIQIHNYEFFHSPTDFHKRDRRLISRDILSKKLKSYLDPKRGIFSGVYLITGFRGIGKTSLVRKVLIEQLRKKASSSNWMLLLSKAGLALITALFTTPYLACTLNLLVPLQDLLLLVLFVVYWLIFEWLFYSINLFGERINRNHRIVELNLSQDQLKEFDVLRSIVWSVYDEYKESLLATRFVSKLFIVAILLLGSYLIADWSYNLLTVGMDYGPSSPEDFLNWSLTRMIFFVAVFFLAFLVLLYSTRWLFNNTHKVGFFTHRYILKRLSKLNDRINASLMEDQRTSLKHFEFKLDFGGKSKNYEKVDEKEIEYELTQIFKQAERVHLGFSARRFVIIFDELDKVDFGKDFSADVRNNRSEEVGQQGPSTYYDFDPERRRREYIANLLSGLKHFFSNARAKFIFIAGTEMFEASLADNTERDSFFGSIFHDVFYVPSFYTDEDHRTSDIKAMTEQYLCRFLIPERKQKRSNHEHDINNSDRYELTLKGYSAYLMKHARYEDDFDFRNKGIKLKNVPAYQSYMSHQAIINKTIFTLYNFIIYLTSRSNGSPKKLSKLLEEHLLKSPNLYNEVRKRPYYVIRKRSIRKLFSRLPYYEARKRLYSTIRREFIRLLNRLPYNKVRKRLYSFIRKKIIRRLLSHLSWKKERVLHGFYLYFQELDQYKFGFNTYLFHPFYFTHSVYLTNHSDKLLVASSFLLGHLYKFHSLAFSRHSLELTPEVVSYSKVPELRKFMEGLFNTISNKHIREINSGLLTHRFRHRIFSEIEFLSRILQQESAIYNFTLDESLPLKRFYSIKLRELETIYSNYNDGSSTRQPFAISHLNSLLADLHFFDKDYDDSLTHYHHALKYLAYVKRHTINTFIHYITNLLKIGLTYEKTKQYERAYGVYSRANEELFKFIGINQTLWEKPINDRTGHRDQFIYFSTFLLLPVVTRFALFEKGGSNGITHEDYVKVITTISEVCEKVGNYREQNFLNEAELNHKIGNVLYYKNSSLFSQGEESWENDEIIQSFFDPRRNLPADALYVYLKNLKDVLSQREDLAPWDPNKLEEVLMATLELVLKDSARTGRGAKKIANYLSKLGDTFLCFENGSHRYLGRAMYNFTESLEKLKGIDFTDRAKFGNWFRKPIFLAIFCYRLSEKMIYREHPILASQRLMKILFVIKDHIKFQNKVIGLDPLKRDYLVLLEQVLVRPILILMNQANEGTRRLSLQQFKINADLPFHSNMLAAENWKPPMLNNSTPEELYPLVLNGSSNSAETSEVIVVFAEIKLKLLGLDSNFINPAHGLSNINNQFNRMWELWHKVHLNHVAWTKVDTSDLTENYFAKNFRYILGKLSQRRDQISKILIVDSIYCLNEIIRAHKVFGISYVHNYTTLATAHLKLGHWCDHLRKWVNSSNKRQKEVVNELEQLIHKESTTYLHSRYHFEQALEYFMAAESMHTGGKDYQHVIQQMYCTEDDLDDESQHFSAASERAKINCGSTRSNINWLRNKLNPSEINKYDNFVYK